MSDHQPGDMVDITVRRARVNATRNGPFTMLSYEVDGITSSVPLTENVTVERIVPAEWPPRAGDLWRDKHGELWFIHKTPYTGAAEHELMGRTTSGLRWTEDVDDLLVVNAPLDLVHREEVTQP